MIRMSSEGTLTLESFDVMSSNRSTVSWRAAWRGAGAAPGLDALLAGAACAGAGSPSTLTPPALTWKTLRHFLHTRRVLTFSRGIRPPAPQLGHFMSIIGT